MVTFNDPKSTGFYVDEGRYQATLIRLDEELSKVSFDGKEPQMRVIWSFHLQDDEGQLMDDRGFPLEYRVYTSQALGEKSKARPMAEALLAGSIAEMSGEQVAAAVLNKTCSVLIADEERSDGSVRSTVMNWAPVRREGSTANRRAVQAAAGRAARGAPTGPIRADDKDLDNIPF